MVDFVEVIKGLKCRQIARYTKEDNNHIMAVIHREQSTGTGYLGFKHKIEIDQGLTDAMCNIKDIRKGCLIDMPDELFITDRLLHSAIINDKVIEFIDVRYLNSIELSMLSRARVVTLKDLIDNGNPILDRYFRRIINSGLKTKYDMLVETYRGTFVDLNYDKQILPTGQNGYKELSQIPSKQFRLALTIHKHIDSFKCGLERGSERAQKVLLTIRKELPSVKHKNLALRILNGDIFTMDRLNRFGLVETSNCVRCLDRETAQHLLLDCPYVKTVWSELRALTGETSTMDDLCSIYEWKQPLYSIETCVRLLYKDRPMLNPARLAQSIYQYVSKKIKSASEVKVR